MTRINDATTTITGALNDHDREAMGVCSTGRNVHPANMIARALDAAGHLLPDLPEPYKSIDGSRHWGHGVSWYPEHGLCRWEDGVGGSTTAGALRQEAAELLAAASYAERNKE